MLGKGDTGPHLTHGASSVTMKERYKVNKVTALHHESMSRAPKGGRQRRWGEDGRQRQLEAHHNGLPVPPGLAAVLHFPTSTVVRCGHVTEFWPMACGCKKTHTTSGPGPQNSPMYCYRGPPPATVTWPKGEINLCYVQ